MGLSEFLVVLTVLTVNLLLLCSSTSHPSVRQHRACWYHFSSNESSEIVADGRGEHNATDTCYSIDSLDLYRGCLGTVALFLLRILTLSLFAAALVWEHLGPACCASRGLSWNWFTYFTNWTFTLYGAQALLGCYTTFKALRSGSVYQLELKVCEDEEFPIRQEPAERPWRMDQLLSSSTSRVQGVLHLRSASKQRWQHKMFTPTERLFSLLFVVVFCNSITVTLFYWVLCSYQNLKLDNIVRHGGDLVPLFLDLMASRHPVSSSHVQWVVAFPSVYLVFMWGLASSTGRWVYGELDWSKPISLVYYLALVLLMLFSFGTVYLLARCREWYHKFINHRSQNGLCSIKNVAGRHPHEEEASFLPA
ncbi:hypothetical protein CEUSTIGMA_g9989.t1 [Chlamydomonas eustigma]|uniref:Uncharacterized protein n=1 Tax=Chlamydomonas eustigma TaxID=1157962 RepID=A0A250XHP3_9CHLO|nr:hypothetical protein CEUSTIGMA_g9989.t1 [Chlamydomonas eustigma]|eukprot:GAX82563.1 hypothetical protein CEUSTIGMA_g9989.t1 [Chlamydomonas eustigma]